MRYFTIAVLLFLCSFANAQQNLVPNPSFEDTVYCPYGLDQIDACQNWLNFGNSPDYFNACATNGVTVPNSNFGFQYAHSGQGRIGIVAFHKLNPDYREFVGIRLTNTLQIGSNYFLSFWISHAKYNNSNNMACNDVGIKLSTIPYNRTSIPNLNNYAQLTENLVISDTVMWSKVSGMFVADSSYQYLMIGNFSDDNNTDTIHIGNFATTAYYYIDDICITQDSLYNEQWTGVKSIYKGQNLIEIYPNPTFDKLEMKSNEQILEVIIYDLLGQQLEHFFNIKNNNFKADVSGFNKGIYLVKVVSLTNNTIQRILINPQ